MLDTISLTYTGSKPGVFQPTYIVQGVSKKLLHLGKQYNTIFPSATVFLRHPVEASTKPNQTKLEHFLKLPIWKYNRRNLGQYLYHITKARETYGPGRPKGYIIYVPYIIPPVRPIHLLLELIITGISILWVVMRVDDMGVGKLPT